MRRRMRFALMLSAVVLLGATRDCRTGTIETTAPIVEATAEVDVNAQVAALAVQIQELNVKVNTIDSWTSIILAASVGLSMICGVASVGVYVVGHRIGWFRAAIDAAKGKACERKEA